MEPGEFKFKFKEFEFEAGDHFSFMECNKDLKTESLNDGDIPEVETAVAALEMEEENEYMEMKKELEESAKKLEKLNVYDSSHVEHFGENENENEGEYLRPFLVIPM